MQYVPLLHSVSISWCLTVVSDSMQRVPASYNAQLAFAMCYCFCRRLACAAGIAWPIPFVWCLSMHRHHIGAYSTTNLWMLVGFQWGQQQSAAFKALRIASSNLAALYAQQAGISVAWHAERAALLVCERIECCAGSNHAYMLS